MFAQSDPTDDAIPDRDGVLFDGGATLADVYDSKRNVYLLCPHAPLAKEVALRPDQRVAVIDSGVARAHPQIAGLVVAERDWTGEGVEDVLGHGTIVTLGILYGQGQTGELSQLMEKAGRANMVAGVVVAKVAPAGNPIKLRDVIAAIHWAASQKVQIVNLSLGFTGDEKDFLPLKKAIESYPNILFFAAAGNYGPRVKVYPAAFGAKNLMSVGVDSPESGKSDILAPTMPRTISPERYAQEEQFAQAMRAAREDRMTEHLELLLTITQTKDHPRAAEAHIRLGVHAVEKKDYSTALQNLNEALKLTPPTAPLLRLVADVSFNHRDFAGAEKNYRATLALSEETPEIRYLIGLCCLRESRYTSALEQFEATHRLDPNYPELATILQELRAAKQQGRLPVD